MSTFAFKSYQQLQEEHMVVYQDQAYKLKFQLLGGKKVFKHLQHGEALDDFNMCVQAILSQPRQSIQSETMILYPEVSPWKTPAGFGLEKSKRRAFYRFSGKMISIVIRLLDEDDREIEKQLKTKQHAEFKKRGKSRAASSEPLSRHTGIIKRGIRRKAGAQPLEDLRAELMQERAEAEQAQSKQKSSDEPVMPKSTAKQTAAADQQDQGEVSKGLQALERIASEEATKGNKPQGIIIDLSSSDESDDKDGAVPPDEQQLTTRTRRQTRSQASSTGQSKKTAAKASRSGNQPTRTTRTTRSTRSSRSQAEASAEDSDAMATAEPPAKRASRRVVSADTAVVTKATRSSRRLVQSDPNGPVCSWCAKSYAKPVLKDDPLSISHH
eukprot:TRINITY_DN9566_c0_g2_i2.p1 TRINITY_DN9566_c0_g2~~TRINITY_DN9566_c0_g2_i2.p1  ORF type:complete len:383 (+),score=74.16 TRINITY_DN9566_c0_g2_i2:191-1339(+)